MGRVRRVGAEIPYEASMAPLDVHVHGKVKVGMYRFAR